MRPHISLFSQTMIAYLKGDFVHKTPASVQLEVNGVGYDVQITLNTYTRLQNLDKGMLHTILIIREDAHLLYGFFEIAEKEMFLQLTSVSGRSDRPSRACRLRSSAANCIMIRRPSASLKLRSRRGARHRPA